MTIGGRESHTLKLLAVSVICLAMVLPFIGRPFHIDDPVYIWTARQIVAHPADFYGFKVNWEGHEVPLSTFCENPPGVAYFMAMVSPLTRWTEVGFHLAFVPFAVLSVIGLYGLATRFCRCPAIVALMLAVSPGFVVSSTTLMCEPPVLCLWIWSVWVWIIATDRRPGLLPVAGALAAAAILTKYSALAVVPLMGLYAGLRPATRRVRLAQAASLLVPIAAVVGYELVTRHLYGTGALGAASKYVAASHAYLQISTPLAAVNTFTFVGGTAVPLALAGAPLLGRRTWIGIALVVGGLTTAAVVMLNAPPLWHGHWGTVVFYTQEAAMTAGGAVALGVGLRQLRAAQWRDDVFLLTWVAGVFFFTAVVNWAINVRSVLPMIPPLCILLGRAIDRRPCSKMWLSTAMTAGALVSLVVARADDQLAQRCKTAAEQLTAGKTPPVYFVGHWGFQYYMQLHGGAIVDETTPQVSEGDDIIYPRTWLGGQPGSTGLDDVTTVSIGPPRWAAAQQRPLGGGFYCSLGHDLPYVFGPAGVETFDIRRVTRSTKIKT